MNRERGAREGRKMARGMDRTTGVKSFYLKINNGEMRR
jgi:hypothetical protein